MQQEIDRLSKERNDCKLRSLVFSDLLAVIVTFGFTLGFLTTTLTSFCEFLGPAVTQLNYWGSGFSEQRPLGIVKRGPSRKLKPIDELFLVLYRLSGVLGTYMGI